MYTANDGKDPSCRLAKERTSYSAFRQIFPKLWTSVAHSFLQQIAQNKSWAHPKAPTLPRIYKVEMEHAFFALLFSKIPIWGHFGLWPMSLYVRTIRFPTFCWSLPSVRSVLTRSQYPAWSRCCRSADVPRADRDHVGWSPWQRGFKGRDTLLAILPFVWFFPHLKM